MDRRPICRRRHKSWRPRIITCRHERLAEGYPRRIHETSEWTRQCRSDRSAGTVPVPKQGIVDEQVRRKIARVSYWYRRLRDARVSVLNAVEQVSGVEIDPDADHPRILAAVKEIEIWTAREEKVLVFGVFVRPLRVLTEVLNVRYALRAADGERPLAHGIYSDPRMLGIAFRQLFRMRREELLPGRLSKADWPEVVRALQDSHKVYERLRRRVRRAAQKPVARWRADPSLLGGAPRDPELDPFSKTDLSHSRWMTSCERPARRCQPASALKPWPRNFCETT